MCPYLITYVLNDPLVEAYLLWYMFLCRAEYLLQVRQCAPQGSHQGEAAPPQGSAGGMGGVPRLTHLQGLAHTARRLQQLHLVGGQQQGLNSGWNLLFIRDTIMGASSQNWPHIIKPWSLFEMCYSTLLFHWWNLGAFEKKWTLNYSYFAKYFCFKT